MSFLYDNLVALTVAAVASALVWIFGGTRGDLLTPVIPWLFVILTDILLCFPQRHREESLYDARERAWGAIKGDPVTWIALGLLVLLIVPFANNGLCPNCDAAKIAQGLSPDPAVPVIPFCVSRLDHLNVFLWFLIVLPAVVAVRNCLTRRGKRIVLELIVWNGLAVAVFGFVQGALGAPGPFWNTNHGTPWGPTNFFATFGYPNMAGDYFTTMFGLSVALWQRRCEMSRKEKALKAAADETVHRPRLFWRRHYYLIPSAVFFFAALNTLSRAAIMLVTTLAVVFFAHTLVLSLSRLKKVKRVKVGVWSLVIFGILIFFASISMPENIRKEVNTLDTRSVLDRVSGREQNQERLAFALWKDYKLFGCGGWGYAHLGLQKLPPKERKKRFPQIGGINVHNDYLQFLVEHGLVGFGALVAIVVFLLIPVVRGWRWLVQEARFQSGQRKTPRPVQIFALPAPVFFILLTAAATLIHAFGDCPLRTPAILIVFFVELAALPGFMPKATQEEQDSRHHRHHHHHHRRHH